MFVFGATAPHWARTSSFTKFLDHTQRRTTVSRTLLEERSAPRIDLYLTTQTTLTTDKHPRPPMGIEPAISAGERPHTHALDRAAIGTGENQSTQKKMQSWYHFFLLQSQLDCVASEHLRQGSVEATSIEEGPISNLVHVNGYADLDLSLYCSTSWTKCWNGRLGICHEVRVTPKLTLFFAWRYRSSPCWPSLLPA